MSVDGMMGHEAAMFLKRIADFLSAKWETDYGLVMGWIRTRLSFAILRATLLCIRGCRTKMALTWTGRWSIYCSVVRIFCLF